MMSMESIIAAASQPKELANFAEIVRIPSAEHFEEAAAAAAATAAAAPAPREPPRPALPECGICFCEQDMLLKCVRLDYEKRIAKTECEHKACKDCLTSWLKTKISEQNKSIRCPFEGCEAVFYGDDIERIAGRKLANDFKRLASQNHRARLRDINRLEPEMAQLMKDGVVRNCPRCGIILWRESGCDSMTCVCGAAFCYGCCSERCGCRFVALGWKLDGPFICRNEKCGERNDHASRFYCYKCRHPRFPTTRPEDTRPEDMPMKPPRGYKPRGAMVWDAIQVTLDAARAARDKEAAAEAEVAAAEAEVQAEIQAKAQAEAAAHAAAEAAEGWVMKQPQPQQPQPQQQQQQQQHRPAAVAPVAAGSGASWRGQARPERPASFARSFGGNRNWRPQQRPPRREEHVAAPAAAPTAASAPKPAAAEPVVTAEAKGKGKRLVEEEEDEEEEEDGLSDLDFAKGWATARSGRK